MTRMWLVRHGQTDWNVEGRYQGQSDVPLNDTGREQARELAEDLASLPFQAIYSSDLKRAVETAQILAKNRTLAVRIEPRLREISQGEWEGLQVQVIVERYAAEFLHVHANPQESRAPGGESVAEVAARIARAADDIARCYPLGPVLVVSHGLALSALYCQSQRISLADVYNHIPLNGQPVVIQWQVNPKTSP